MCAVVFPMTALPGNLGGPKQAWCFLMIMGALHGNGFGYLQQLMA